MAARALIALGAAALVAAAATADSTAAAGPVELRWSQVGQALGEGEVRVEGLPAAALARLPGGELDGATGESLLRVVVSPAGAAAAEALGALPNAWGAWAVREGVLAFRPRHVLAPGATLHAAFSGARFDALTGARGTPDASLRLDVPAGESVTTVLAVAPGGDTIPENLLRLYVHFSGPMSLRGIERHVRLLDAAGDEIRAAFVEVPGGLWDPERRRLTLFVHPGRRKSGLEMRERMGPVLARGAAVTLEVDAGALDAEGRPLARPFARTWRVGPPVEAPLDPASWALAAPVAPRGALLLAVPSPLDAAIARRAITVLDAQGAPVPGTLELSADGRHLRFAPAADWRPGETYRLRVEPFLEDPSGNRLGHAFETAAGASREAAAGERTFVPLAAAASPSAATKASAARP